MNVNLKNPGSADLAVRVEWDEYRRIVHILEPLSNPDRPVLFLQKVQPNCSPHAGPKPQKRRPSHKASVSFFGVPLLYRNTHSLLPT